MATPREETKTAGAAVTTPAAAVAAADSDGEPFVIQEFRAQLKADSSIAVQLAAIRALTEVIRRSSERTAQGLLIELKAAADTLKSRGQTLLGLHTSISLTAGCELLVRHVTRTSKLDNRQFDMFKADLVERGDDFANVSMRSRARVATSALGFIRDETVILTHGYSRAVLTCLQAAAAASRTFSVLVTEGRPECAGHKMAKCLAESGIKSKLIIDSAMGFVMESVDMVLVGAEAVVENGGIINKIGTFQCAVVAHAMKVPVYVAAESYKFSRLFPLRQQDIVETVVNQRSFSIDDDDEDRPATGELEIENPFVDYTPPKYITLMFTDLGVLTPSAVSDELIKLYS